MTDNKMQKQIDFWMAKECARGFEVGYLMEALEEIQKILPLHKYTTAETCQKVEDIVERALSFMNKTDNLK